MLALESARAMKAVEEAIEEAALEVCFPTSLIYGLISRLSVEYEKLIPLEQTNGWTQCRQRRFK